MYAWAGGGHGDSDEDVIPANRFEPEQYVRVRLSSTRTEIGVVQLIDEAAGTARVSTQQGYEMSVKIKQLSRAFLLVLDLNGVLVHRSKTGFTNRPYAREFIRFAMSNFVVAVWTSGMAYNSDPMIASLFKDYTDRLLFTFYRDACTMRPTPEKPYGTVKNLQKIFDLHPKSFHAVNTIIVDDSPEKCSHPDIALCPIPYTDPESQVDDDGLMKAELVLKEVLEQDSLKPLIRAAEERLDRLEEMKHTSGESAMAESSLSLSLAASLPEHERQRLAGLRQQYEWKMLLCCHFISGTCKFGSACRYSHDPDDGVRPCNSKGSCRAGHATRWVLPSWDMQTRTAGTANAPTFDRMTTTPSTVAPVAIPGRHTKPPAPVAQDPPAVPDVATPPPAASTSSTAQLIQLLQSVVSNAQVTSHGAPFPAPPQTTPAAPASLPKPTHARPSHPPKVIGERPHGSNDAPPVPDPYRPLQRWQPPAHGAMDAPLEEIAPDKAKLHSRRGGRSSRGGK